MEAVPAIRRENGIDDIHLVKPGIGETTRVLLRRVPDAVLVSPGTSRPPHILMLAESAACRSASATTTSTPAAG